MIPRPFLPCLVAASLALGPVLARAQETTRGFKLKNRSSFSAGETARNPFWPIGWVKNSGPAESTTEVQVDIRPEDFALSSISIFGSTRLALINGRARGEGDYVPLTVNGRKIRVAVVAIQDGAVVLRYENKDFTVMLKRKETELLNKPAVRAPELQMQEE